VTVEIIDAAADVVVVGLGPTGLTLASLLGAQGHRVAVVERWPALYGKPRLTHIDGETARLLNHCCDVDSALRESWVVPQYSWVNGKGRQFLDVAAGNSRRMLWDDHITVHQPHIEEALLERIQRFDNVVLYRGYRATSLSQDGDGVSLVARPWSKGDVDDAAGGDEVRLRARYLVGADGSKSFVRESLGVPRQDLGFNERWLCVDTVPLTPLPAKFDQNAVQVCDPARGHMFMPIGRQRQRFEFALLAHERTEDMQAPEAAHRLLQQYHGIKAEDVELVRVIVYTFECRLAQAWRSGRVFLAGDAAHTNPPYLGQGACSGMRDASNLAWKLNLVLRGLAGDELLDTYHLERMPHARKLMLDSRGLGKLANTRSRALAAARDLVFRLNLIPAPSFPVLTDGVLARDDAGRLQKPAGSVPGQGRVADKAQAHRLDDVTPFGFVLISRRPVLAGLPADLRSALPAIGLHEVVVTDQPHGAEQPGGDTAVYGDIDGVYGRMLDDLDADLLVVRPDLVLYGHARADHAEALLHGLVRRLRTPLTTQQPA
jgi:3-(3-hydroxy-phenyl)propionate hydroxylase